MYILHIYDRIWKKLDGMKMSIFLLYLSFGENSCVTQFLEIN